MGVPQGNFHFLLRLGVRGTALNSYNFRVFDSAEARAPEAPDRVYRYTENTIFRRRSSALRAVENPKFVRISGVRNAFGRPRLVTPNTPLDS